ncbi:hypothetical protein REMIM1_PC00049 (plasmid) [Rhizobium etli bv. mimosae str. Mim1]|nr:hypothetical protein REMIM1_PC00049 [Rhizobium etli bv. mimosae str. Mim1]
MIPFSSPPVGVSQPKIFDERKESQPDGAEEEGATGLSRLTLRREGEGQRDPRLFIVRETTLKTLHEKERKVLIFKLNCRFRYTR